MIKRSQKIIAKRVIFIIGILIVVIFGKILIDAVRYSPVLVQLLFKKEISLKKTDNHVNILLLGIGGGAHEGPNLTDTIIFSSIDPDLKRIAMVSIPRDLWVPDLKAKVNTAYAFGEEKRPGGGLLLAKAAIGKVLQQKIDYAVRIDFDGFVKAVDMVGGIDVIVDNAFDDEEYPIAGKENETCDHTEEEITALATASSQLDAFPCRYEKLHFDQGLQHMDGQTALKFVRSRHATGKEGTDFARSKRQEKVILAFKEKVFSLQTMLNPIKVVSLYNIVKGSIDTDIVQDEFDDFIRLAKKMEHVNFQSHVLDIGDEEAKRAGLLINPVIDGTADFGYQWVLIPKAGNGNYSAIQSYVACVVKSDTCDSTLQQSIK